VSGIFSKLLGSVSTPVQISSPVCGHRIISEDITLSLSPRAAVKNVSNRNERLFKIDQPGDLVSSSAWFCACPARMSYKCRQARLRARKRYRVGTLVD
jgi:hypothetical protein